MRQVRLGFFSAVVVLSLIGGASAETTDAKKDHAREAKQISTEAQEAEAGTDAGEQKSIKTQGTTKRKPVATSQERGDTQKESVGTNQNETVTQQEPVGFVEQLKEGAKGEVNRRGNQINEKIERFGQE